MSTENEKAKGNKPVHKIRRGALQATIWRHTNPDKGTTWYNVDLDRGFKRDDGTWQETKSLNQDDLLPARKLLDEADTWIVNEQRAATQARREKDAEPAAA